LLGGTPTGLAVAELADNAFDAVLDQRHIKVDQETESLSGQLELGEQLGHENRVVFRRRLQLTDALILHEYVEPQTFIELEAVIS